MSDCIRRGLPEFFGVPTATLQAWLAECQTALQQLAAGKNANVLSYSQGAGSKSVTYTQADKATLEQRIMSLARELGLATPRRRPMRPIY